MQRKSIFMMGIGIVFCTLTCAVSLAQPMLLPPAGGDAPKVESPEFLGRVAVPPSLVEEAVTVQAVLPVETLEPTLPVESPILVTTPAWYHPAYWFGPDPWDIGFELGVNGNEGINESLSLRVGGHINRETERWKFDNSLVYNKNTANDVETQNNALLDSRVDRVLGASRWSLFFLNQVLYDEFQAFDLRVSLSSGVGYQFIDSETIDLTGSFGAGASREFGAVVEETAYEALFGLNYEHDFSKTQRFSAKVDYFPEWGDFSLYRIVTDFGWEIDLDRPKNVSLKFSVIDRYDSTPNGVEPNEINYAALLIWGL